MMPRTLGFWRDQRGAAAVEAAIVVPGFLVMILMIVQIGLMLAAQTMLDNAARDAARLIALGQVQTGGGASAFASRLCSDISGPVSCADLQYNVVSGASFSGLQTAITLDGNGNLPSPQFSPGGPGADVWWDPLESTCRHASLSIL